MVPGPQIPFQKVGTVYQNPAWRFEAIQDPFKFSLKKFLSRTDGQSPGHLKRFLYKGIKYTNVFSYPQYLIEVSNKLSNEQSLFLKVLWEKNHIKLHKNKINCSDQDERGAKVICWNMENIPLLNDDYFHKTAQHIVGIKGFKEISFALTLKTTPELSNTFAAMGYMIYAGIPDIEIAKRWRISVNKAEAVRMLFFDFSHFPKDRIARFALLNHLKNTKVIDATDFAYYKRVYDLGELGLKAQIDYIHLTDEEKSRIHDYLGFSMIVNTLDLNMGIKTARDSLNYTRVVTDFARLSLEKEELKHKQVQTDLVRLRMKQLSQQSELTIDIITPEDKLLLEKMRQMSLEDATDIPFISVADLK